MAAFDNLLHECEAFAATLWNAVAGAAGGFVYVVVATGEEIPLPARSVIETTRQYIAPDEKGVAIWMTLVDFDILSSALVNAAGRPVRPEPRDTIRRVRDGVQEVFTLVPPVDRQCWEMVGSCYIRVHCEQEEEGCE